MAISKTVEGPQAGCAGVQSGMTLMLGGFGLCGIPECSIAELVKLGTKDLTCISNNAGVDDFGLGLLLQKRQIRKMISSYVGENDEFERQMLSGELEVDLIPQGSLAERCRAGGSGIPAFFTPAGYGTEVAEGKEVREFDGKPHILESALTADFAFVKAWKGDSAGNLVFKATARNFNPMMAMAGKITVAEVEELVPLGALDPNEIHLPGIFVQRIFQGADITRSASNSAPFKPVKQRKKNPMLDKNGIAKRIAQEVRNGWYVNLGIGIPTLVANFIPEGMEVEFQSENGILGMGPFPMDGDEDADLINAGKQTITAMPGAVYFDSATSFAMIRGRHVQLTVLGAMEVAQNGDIANWKIPGKMVKGMGGAMDLVASAENIIVAMMHTNRAGASKLLPSCSLPLTGVGCVKRVVTNLAVMDIKDGAFHLVERAPGVTVQDIAAATAGKLVIPENVPEMNID